MGTGGTGQTGCFGRNAFPSLPQLPLVACLPPTTLLLQDHRALMVPPGKLSTCHTLRNSVAFLPEEREGTAWLLCPHGQLFFQ